MPEILIATRSAGKLREILRAIQALEAPGPANPGDRSPEQRRVPDVGAAGAPVAGRAPPPGAGGMERLRCVVWRTLEDFPDVPEAIEDGHTFEENARIKALHYAGATGLLTLADDSGLEVDALGGQPGVHSAHWAGLPRDDAANNRKLVEALRDVPSAQRSARYRCVMVLARPGQVLAQTQGTLEGRIIDCPRGTHGFGYDPHFLIPELGRTAAELTPDEKNAISHRGQALRRMLVELGQFI